MGILLHAEDSKYTKKEVCTSHTQTLCHFMSVEELIPADGQPCVDRGATGLQELQRRV